MSLSRFLVQQLGRPSRPTAGVLNIANARINREAIELLELSPDHRVLEVGFGGGVALKRLLGQAAFIAAIDPSEAAVRAARKRFAGEVLRGRLRRTSPQAAVDAMPFNGGSFERALTVNTIYFWTDPLHGLVEILRILTPCGRLMLATGARRVPAQIARQGFTSYSEEAQVDLLRRAGFCDVHVERRPPFLFALAAKPPAARQPHAASAA
jgi:SAM-dependent methyltransferase